MTDRVQQGSLQIATVLHELLENDIAEGTGIAPGQFWQALEAIVNDLAPRNRALLQTREELQAKIDGWHRENPGAGYDKADYKAFLQEIGYLVPEGGDFAITTEGVGTGSRHPGRPPAGRAGNERPLCAQCCQCPLGQPVLCPVRHRRYT